MSVTFDPLISPKYRASDFDQFSTGEKIIVFEDRLFGWVFNVCDQIYDNQIENCEFAILKIIGSTFEMLGKHIKGYVGEQDSFKHFDIGFNAIYFDTYERRASELFYKFIRNSIYHSGFVSSNVFITETIQHPFGYDSNNFLLLNIRVLYEDLKYEVKRYIFDLNNVENAQLRNNFEKRFDFEGGDFYNQLLEKLDQSEI